MSAHPLQVLLYLKEVDKTWPGRVELNAAGVGNGSQLTVRYLIVLIHLCETGQPMRLVALAQTFGWGKPCVSRAVKILEQFGLITRTRGTHDRRDLFIAPTEAGRRLVGYGPAATAAP